ncbi:MAG: secondary thiamine-phosphate synthase enzyme YjbQ [Sneathiella sp.]
MTGLQQKSGRLACRTSGRGLYDVTEKVNAWIEASDLSEGSLTILIQHTSASLTVQENADPDVQLDLLNFMNKLAPDDPGLYHHTAEGADDMPSHIRSSLTDTSLHIPVMQGRMRLGTWQGLYVFEHRLQPHTRNLALHIVGA